MSSSNASSRSRRPGQLLLGVVGLLVLAIAGIVAMAASDAGWGLAVALAAAGTATVVALLGVGATLADLDGAVVRTPARRTAVAFACGAVVAVAVGVTAVIQDASAEDSQSLRAGTAERTVRDFLTDAAVDQNGYVACQLLTASEQARVAVAAGSGDSCRQAMTNGSPAVAGVASPHGLNGLRLRATVSGGHAVVTVRGAGTALRFGLDRTTPAELAAFDAPGAPWHIASGAEALVRS